MSSSLQLQICTFQLILFLNNLKHATFTALKKVSSYKGGQDTIGLCQIANCEVINRAWMYSPNIVNKGLLNYWISKSSYYSH